MRHKPRALKDLESLYELYERLNRKFFAGALPKEIRIVIVPVGRRGYSIDTRERDDRNREMGCTTSFPGIPEALQTVELNELAMADMMTATVVMAHEMIHVKGVLNHGAEFKKEVDRLAKEGLLREIL